MNETFGIVAFRSRQQVLRFEQQLRREGLGVQVISTPRDVAVGCGLSVRFQPRDTQAVINAMHRTRPGNVIGVYQVERGGGRARLTAISR